MMKIKKVGVVGCGMMGPGIVQVSADAGYETVLAEIGDAPLQNGIATIDRFLSSGVEKRKLTAERKEEILGLIHGTTNLEELADVDIVIEAISEDLGRKKELYRDLDGTVRDDTIFASNTSALCIAEMAAATHRPERFVGLHFFNPVPLMKLVEVITTLATDPKIRDTVTGFARSLGKTPIQAPDRPGFIVNRLLIPYLLDAVRALEEGSRSKEDIDVGMKLGCGYPMGPFELMDMIGLDRVLDTAEILYAELRQRRFAPPPLLRRMVLANRLGRKSGIGFYSYT